MRTSFTLVLAFFATAGSVLGQPEPCTQVAAGTFAVCHYPCLIHVFIDAG
jgi:hypothetical protein